MDPEFLRALELVAEFDQQRPKSIIEHRLYYDEQGKITAYYETDHPPDENYIILDDPDVFFNSNTNLLRVVDGKLIKIEPVVHVKYGIQRSTVGQRVVKGMASLPLMPTEEYQDVEYYDLKRNC